MPSAPPNHEFAARIDAWASELNATPPEYPVLRYPGNQQQDPDDYRVNVISLLRHENGAFRIRRHELDVCRWDLEECPDYWHSVDRVIERYMVDKGRMTPVHTVADVMRWTLGRFRHPVDHAKWLHAACLLSYRGYDQGCWFSFFDMRSHEFGYGTVSQAELDSITELAKSPLHRDELRAMLASNATPLGGQQQDRLLCISEGRHPMARPDFDFRYGATSRT